MPLTDEQLNSYEQGLRKDIDDQAKSSLGNIGNAYPDYGASSMTNTINNLNYNRQKQYLDALAAREDLAQKWQQTANQRAMTQGQIKQMSDENSRGIATLGLQRQSNENSNQNNREQNRIQEKHVDAQIANYQSSNELEKQKAEDARRQNAIANAINLRLQHANMQLQKKQISLQDWASRTNATLQHMGLQIDMQKVELLKNPPPPDTSHKELLTWLSNIITPINSAQNASDNLQLQREGQAQDMATQQMRNKLALMQLSYQNQNNLIHNFTNLAYGALGAFA